MAGRRVREDRAADGEAAVADSAPTAVEDGLLRGEKPEESPVERREWQRAAGAVAGDRPKAVGSLMVERRSALWVRTPSSRSGA